MARLRLRTLRRRVARLADGRAVSRRHCLRIGHRALALMARSNGCPIRLMGRCSDVGSCSVRPIRRCAPILTQPAPLVIRCELAGRSFHTSCCHRWVRPERRPYATATKCGSNSCSRHAHIHLYRDLTSITGLNRRQSASMPGVAASAASWPRQTPDDSCEGVHRSRRCDRLVQMWHVSRYRCVAGQSRRRLRRIYIHANARAHIHTHTHM